MLLFRDPTGASMREPPWLAGCPDVHRLITDRGEILAACDPLFLAPPLESAWRPLVDGWQVALVGELDLDRLYRRRPDIESLLVEDAKGRAWYAPLILTEDGQVALDVPYGRDTGTGTFVRCPDPEQARLIAAAEGARAQMLGAGLGRLPATVALDWCGVLLEATYHLPREALYALALLGDRLIAAVLFTAAGHPPIRGAA